MIAGVIDNIEYYEVDKQYMKHVGSMQMYMVAKLVEKINDLISQGKDDFWIDCKSIIWVCDDKEKLLKELFKLNFISYRLHGNSKHVKLHPKNIDDYVKEKVESA